MDKIRLDQLLFNRRLAASRNQAAALIMAGQVKVDGKLATKAGHAIDISSKIAIAKTQRYVSRAALKLESVAGKLGVEFKNKIVLDVGSSTGGFTDFALQHGAAKVYAVDVGTNQLVGKLRAEPRVVVMEKTDIRDVRGLSDKIDITLVDVSFISLQRILLVLPPLLAPDGQIVAMAKPQFEADKAIADKHRGVIKNDTIRRKILSDLELWIKQHFQIVAKADSEVTGVKGNRERFYLLSSLKY